MRIALLSTCAVTVPPKGYGGTELVIAELAKMLTRRGHDVTVYATGDSRPAGTLRYRFTHPVWPPNELAELRHAAFAWGNIAHAMPRFDVVHAHQAPSVAFSAVHLAPVVLTLHHKRETSLLDYYLDFPDVTYVAISRRQAELVPELPIRHVVHHGLDPELYPVGDGDGGYCAFLGRFSEEKAPHIAIDTVVAAGERLKMGGVPHWVNQAYFEQQVQPRLTKHASVVDWVHEISHGPKLDLLRHARAFLFPLGWEEPFGLVMIESMLVGTPVIAFARGGAPEVVEDGVTGFLVHDEREMTARLREIGRIDRRRCRARAVERWGSMRMAADYERIYEEALRRPRASRPAMMWGEGEGGAEGRPRPSALELPDPGPSSGELDVGDHDDDDRRAAGEPG